MQIPLLWNLWLDKYKLGLILTYKGGIDLNISIGLYVKKLWYFFDKTIS